LHAYSEKELTDLEHGGDRSAGSGPFLGDLLAVSSVAVPLRASTKASVLKELVKLAEQSWQVYDADTILAAIRAREELASTALPAGVAIPHPRRPLPSALGESVLAFGSTTSGIPFGAPLGGLTDLFFLGVFSRGFISPNNAIRAAYNQADAAQLPKLASALQNQGNDSQAVARACVDLRNALKVEVRSVMRPKDVAVLEAGELAKWGNPIGPSADQLFAKYQSWDEVIAASLRTNPDVNAQFAQPNILVPFPPLEYDDPSE
jgi:mannitol/fructose-specific phosphotransferase system IIA component (Ntr-type)